MKSPDVLDDCIEKAAREQTDSLLLIDEDERDEIRKMRALRISKLCGRWFEYGEYLTVEIDTDTGTCVIVPVK